MSPQTRYYLRFVGYAPLLPLLYMQGKQVRSTVPVLPEAEGERGTFPGGGETFRLLALGESTVAGVGMGNHRQGFTGWLARQIAERIGRRVDYRAVARSGFNAERVRRELVPRIAGENPDLIVLGIGGNDAFQLNSPSRFRAEAIGLLEAVRHRQPSAPILIANLPPIRTFPAFPATMQRFLGGLVELYDQAILDLPHRFERVHYAAGAVGRDWRERHGSSLEIEELYCDGVHPSALTYRLWSEDLATLAADRGII